MCVGHVAAFSVQSVSWEPKSWGDCNVYVKGELYLGFLALMCFLKEDAPATMWRHPSV